MTRANWLAPLTLLVCITAFSRASLADPALGGWLPDQMFPSDNWWNVDVTWVPVDWRSDDLINSVGRWTQLHPDVGGNYWDDRGERNYGFASITGDLGEVRVPGGFFL